MKWLLDTNVLSELRRPRPEPRVVSFVADRPLELLTTTTFRPPSSPMALNTWL
jgi:predicted nucleic acid-binding protein